MMTKIREVRFPKEYALRMQSGSPRLQECPTYLAGGQLCEVKYSESRQTAKPETSPKIEQNAK